MVIADTLSRAYISDTSTDRMEDELMSAVHMVLENAPATDKRIQEIKELTESDTTLQRLKSVIRSGWPDERTDLPEDVQSYWNFRGELSEAEGIVMKGEKIVIPTSLRKDMLTRIHRGHLGIVKCTQRAREAIYWPGMCKDIEELVGKCEVCQRYRESNTKEPLISEPISDKPWDSVAMDLFQWNNNDYVLIVDYYSRYFEVSQLEDTTSRTVITHTKSIFARHGIPRFLRSDNGPQFSSAEFKSFGSEWGFTHETTSPYHPQANGLAEKFVQTVKRLLNKAKADHQDPYLSILEYRNTPIDNIGSPAQLLMSPQTTHMYTHCGKASET